MRKLVPLVTILAVAAAPLLVMSPAEAGTRYSVSVTASTTKADVGQNVTLSGRVTPKAKREQVLVQRLAGSTWITVARPRLDRHSRYTAAVAVASPGDNAYRVVKPRSDHHPKGISGTVTVVGWRWRSLAGMPVYQAANATALDSGKLGPLTFSPYIKLGSPSATFGYFTYILDGKCSHFDAHVGVSPDSSSFDVQTAILAGSTLSAPLTFNEIAENHVVPGDDPVHVVRGPEVIDQVAALQVYANTSTGTYVAWGGAQVYCRS